MSPLSSLRHPAVVRTFALSFVARLPMTVVGILVLLHARDLGLSYGMAGVAAGALTFGMATGSPLIGRAVDAFGQSTVLALAGLISGSAVVGLSFVPEGRAPLLLVLAVLVGFAQPPVGACARVIWGRLLSARDRDMMFAIDVTTQGIAFIIGPASLLAVASSLGADVALQIAGGMLAAGTLVFAMDPVTRAERVVRRNRRVPTSRPMSLSSVRTIVAITTGLGIAFGAVEVANVATADLVEGSASLPVLMAMWSIGAVVGGPLWAMRPTTSGGPRDAALLAIGVAGTCGMLALPLPAWWLLPSLFLFGALVTPLSILLYSLLAATTPDAVLTEAYAWEFAAMTGGIAVGTSAAGWAVGTGGPAWGFVLAALATGASATIALVGSGSLRSSALADCEQLV